MKDKQQPSPAPGVRHPEQDAEATDREPAADPQLAGRRGLSAGLQPGGRGIPTPPRRDAPKRG